MSLEEIRESGPHALTDTDEYFSEDYVWREWLGEYTSLQPSSVVVICDDLTQIIIGCGESQFGGSALVPFY